jgi:hypothetical protein
MSELDWQATVFVSYQIHLCMDTTVQNNRIFFYLRGTLENRILLYITVRLGAIPLETFSHTDGKYFFFYFTCTTDVNDIESSSILMYSLAIDLFQFRKQVVLVLNGKLIIAKTVCI